jgi:Uma2 family endonuclease
MSVATESRLVRRRMSLEEFHALPEKVRAEFVDGEVVVTPPSTMPHNEVGLRLAILLRGALSGGHVGFEMGLRLGPRRFRIPDVAVVDRLERTRWTEQTPRLVVEVLSPSTRTEDTLRKTVDYREAGVGQYWLVDTEARTMTVLVDNGNGWDVAAELDEARPVASIAVGNLGTVPVDLTTLLADLG